MDKQKIEDVKGGDENVSRLNDSNGEILVEELPSFEAALVQFDIKDTTSGG